MALMVAVVIIIVVFFAVAFVFLFAFFLGWLLSKEDIGGYRPIRRVRAGHSGCILLMSDGTPRTTLAT
jgi:hypothetical protein